MQTECKDRKIRKYVNCKIYKKFIIVIDVLLNPKVALNVPKPMENLSNINLYIYIAQIVPWKLIILYIAFYFESSLQNCSWSLEILMHDILYFVSFRIDVQGFMFRKDYI